MEEKNVNSPMQSLQDLKVGDEVYVTMSYYKPSIEKITRITATQIEACGRRFNRDSGTLRSGDKWFVGRISIPTEQDRSNIRLSAKKHELKKKIKEDLIGSFKDMDEDKVDALTKEIDKILITFN